MAPTMKRAIQIDRLLDELSDYWYAHPELRLGQIICNFAVQLNGDPYQIADVVYINRLTAANKPTN